MRLPFVIQWVCKKAWGQTESGSGRSCCPPSAVWSIIKQCFKIVKCFLPLLNIKQHEIINAFHEIQIHTPPTSLPILFFFPSMPLRLFMRTLGGEKGLVPIYSMTHSSHGWSSYITETGQCHQGSICTQRLPLHRGLCRLHCSTLIQVDCNTG